MNFLDNLFKSEDDKRREEEEQKVIEYNNKIRQERYIGSQCTISEDGDFWCGQSVIKLKKGTEGIIHRWVFENTYEVDVDGFLIQMDVTVDNVHFIP